MVRSGSGTVIAAVVAATIVSGTVIVFSATVVANHLIAVQVAHGTPARQADGYQSDAVNRNGKSDALPVSAAKQPRAEIKSVEVVGLREVSIIYRDREGNVLFRTDPLANVTVVSKNVDLPEVTIRETIATEVERMEVESLPAEKTAPSLPLQGCESAFARPSPEALTRKLSRCVTRLLAPGDITNIAAVH